MDDRRVVRMTYLTIWELPSLSPFTSFCSFCSVPISKLPQLVHETQKDMEHSGILYSVVGHAGDGG